MSQEERSIGSMRLKGIDFAAQYLGVSKSYIYNGIAPNSKKPLRLKAKRIGKRVLFDIRDLDRFIEELGSES